MKGTGRQFKKVSLFFSKTSSVAKIHFVTFRLKSILKVICAGCVRQHVANLECSSSNLPSPSLLLYWSVMYFQGPSLLVFVGAPSLKTLLLFRGKSLFSSQLTATLNLCSMFSNSMASAYVNLK